MFADFVSLSSLVTLNLMFAGLALAIGFGLGAWMFGGTAAKPNEDVRSQQRDDELQHAAERAMMASQRIQDLAKNMACDVDAHAVRVEEINTELQAIAEVAPSEEAEAVFSTIGRMIDANNDLQKRLLQAEKQIAAQAADLRSYETEARTDSLTGLANRRAFDDEMQRRFAEWQRRRSPFTLIILDIDHFKKFNDTYGHQTGDDVLCHVACTLSMVMRDVDLVCRYGGEEFAIILPATESPGAILAAERARTAIERMVVESNGQQLKVTVSGGIAEALAGEEVEALVARADQGLYASKKAGRNCVHLHDGTKLIPSGKQGTSEPAKAAEPKQAEAKSADKVAADAGKDPLQSLPNREAFAEDVRRRVEQHHKYHAPVTILYCGVDQFAGVVKQHGHEAGNVVLRAVAQFLKAVLRDQEMLARIAEDRFAIVLAGVTAGEATQKIERIRQAIEKCRLPVDGLDEVRFTASFGLAEINELDDATVLMNRGLEAYAQAATKQNCIQVEGYPVAV